MIFTDISIRNRTTVFVLVFLIIVIGTYSYITLPREAAPDIPIPYVQVITTMEGVSPEDMESSVTLKIEKEFTGLDGLKEMTSVSAEGMSLITLEFVPDVKLEKALQDVRDKVDLAKPDLPSDADEPYIKEINIATAFPVMIINMSGEFSPVRMKAIADDLSDTIEGIPGVLKAEVSGELEREIRVEVDPDRLDAYDLTIPELLQLIPSENVNISAGGLETGKVKFNVRVPGEFGDPGEIDHLLLATRGGKPIYLSDVAAIRDAFKDRTSYSRLNGADSISISVQKRSGANIVFIADAVKRVLAEARKQVPEGVSFDITLDFSKYIRMMVADLENNILSGFVLVVAVLFLFLGFRTSGIIAIAVPLSMLMSYVAIQALGYTLNMIVLFSLILALGMLVDNAIVIVENIYRHIQLGYSRVEAAIRGSREVAWPVTTSTLTTVAAFLPLLFWPGIVGEFMKYLPVTLMITLMCSLFVALVVNPTVASIFASGSPKKSKRENWFVHAYRRFVETALSHRVTTLSLAVLILLGVGFYYAKMGHGVEFFPEMDPDNAYFDIRAPQGTNIHETNRLAELVEARLEPYRPYLENVVTTVGGEEGGAFLRGGSSGPNNARITLVFYDYAIRKRPSMEVIADIRRDIADIPGAEIKLEREREGPPTGAPVTVRISGKDFKVLQQLSDEAKALIVTVPGLVNLRSDLEAAKPELVFHVDRRRAMLLGVNTATIGSFLKTAIFGRSVGTFRDFNEEYDITIRLPLSQRENIDDLFRLQVPNASGRPAPLSSLGRFDYQGGFGNITRVNEQRVVTLTADNEGRQSNAVLKDARQRLQELQLPPGYQIHYAGEQEEQEEATRFLIRAFFIAILLIVLILVAQFNSLIIPIIIMSTVVLSLIGALSGLLICKCPFGIIMTGVGIISLAGVVVNNAIVLLAYTRQLQDEGLELVQAAVRAGCTRLRPVLLTAATTIIGLIPLATGLSFDFHKFEWATRSQMSQWWKNMAVTVIFGLGFATVLTLVVVPTLYVSLYRLAAKFGLGGLRKPLDETASQAEGPGVR